MSANKKRGYGRVSSRGQQRSGNSLEDQKIKLMAAGCAEEDIVLEVYTGTEMGRPKLDALLSSLLPGDEFLVCKLDRFARTAAEGSLIVRDLVSRGVVVNILNMGRADNTPMGKLMVTVLLAFAEYERDMIVERTSAGKALAKENNPEYKDGRKPLEIPDEFEYLRLCVATGELTVSAACAELGISRSTWYKWAKRKPQRLKKEVASGSACY